MPATTEFGSPDVARKIAELFGTRPKKVAIELKYARPVRVFLRKIEKAHRNAGAGDLVFR